MFDDLSSNEAKRGPRLSLLRLQDYADDARANSDVMAAVQLTRVQPLRAAGSIRTRVERGLLRAAQIKRTDRRASVSGIRSNSVDELVSQP
jgi:hypothetical protein